MVRIQPHCVRQDTLFSISHLDDSDERAVRDTTAPSWAGNALFAEIASCQLEFKYLAHLTGREDFFFKVDKVVDYMEESQRKDGLWSTYWDVRTGAQVGCKPIPLNVMRTGWRLIS